MEVNVTATTEQNVFNVTVAQGGSGSQGPKGDPGESAYQIALDNGFVGTEQEWLESLVGPQGEAGPQGDPGEQGPQGDVGESAYEAWMALGNEGTEQDFIDSLKGEQGIQGVKGDTGPAGADGSDGQDGITPHIDESTGNWFIGTTDTGVHAEGPQGIQGIQGEEGPQGPKGDQGDPGQDVLKFYGTQAEYDALPADKLTNGVEHFIAADPQP